MKKSLVERIQHNIFEDENENTLDLLEQMANWIKENPQEGLAIARDINGYDGSLEELDYWENDEEFFEAYYPNNAMEAVRAACYGEYDYTDDYVKIDVYGNLQSASETDLENEIVYWAADIIELLIDNYDEYSGYVEIPEELNNLIQQHLATRPGPSEE